MQTRRPILPSHPSGPAPALHPHQHQHFSIAHTLGLLGNLIHLLPGTPLHQQHQQVQVPLFSLLPFLSSSFTTPILASLPSTPSSTSPPSAASHHHVQETEAQLQQQQQQQGPEEAKRGVDHHPTLAEATRTASAHEDHRGSIDSPHHVNRNVAAQLPVTATAQPSSQLRRRAGRQTPGGDDQSSFATSTATASRPLDSTLETSSTYQSPTDDQGWETTSSSSSSSSLSSSSSSSYSSVSPPSSSLIPPTPPKMVARNTSSYLPLAESPSSAPASGRICGPSSSVLSSLARKLKKILLLLITFVVLLQLVVLVPYFAGEERMKGWGLEAVPHPAPPQWMQPGSWAKGPPGHAHPDHGPPPPGPPGHGPPGAGPPAGHGPPNHGPPDHGPPADHGPPPHGPPVDLDAHPQGYGKDRPLPPAINGATGYASGTAALNASSAFPPPYHKSFHVFDYTHQSDANPHLGQIPALHLSVLNAVPVLVAPPFPPKAPEINSTVYNLRPWDKELMGSNTTFQDSFEAHLQPVEEDPRSAPFDGWEPPLALLDTSKPPADKLGKVQYAFTDPTRRSGKQGDEAREKLLTERQRLVRNAFLHAWSGYKRLAWGHDELRPVSEKAQDNFNGWGATIVDALDTLLVMDLPGEYDLARSHVRDIDFALVGGERSAYGSSDGRLPVFETAIRYLGGMLAAYDLSGDELMKDRAEELAQRLEAAFNTRSGVPVGRIRLAEDINQPPPPVRGGFGSAFQFASVVLSEAGSMLLEYTRLWQATGNRAYFDRVQRVTDWFDKNMTEAAGQGGMLYNIIFPEQHVGHGSISFGGMSDSYYEYLIKEHQLLGGRVPQYGRMYSAAVDTARGLIIRDIHSVPNATLVVPGVFENKVWNGKLEHLACFTGAMIGLGAKLMPQQRGEDYGIAQRITETCWWTYNSTNTGIGPEYTIFYEDYDPQRSQVGQKVGKYGKTSQPAGWPIEGIRGQLPDYRGRPETIESVFYMWRITGDPVWQERGWQMFSSWVTHSMTNVGFANIQDVNKVPAPLMDSMESFVFAETFKYYYLLFSPPDLISLDDYVLTTEAHPLLVPQNGKWVQPGKGPRTFWSGLAGSTKATKAARTGRAGPAYTGGEVSNTAPGLLTNAQKHSVYAAYLERMAEKERKEAAKQARIALNRAVQAAKERGEDAVSALMARMKGWVGGSEEEAAGLQKRSSTSEGNEGTAPASAAAGEATTCAEASSAPTDEALMSRVKSELNALIQSAIGDMDEDTSSDSGSPQVSAQTAPPAAHSSASSAAQGQYFASDSDAQDPAAAAEENVPSSTTPLDLPDGYVSILVETDVEVPVEVRFHPQAFAYMEMTDEDLARWLARENTAPARTVSSWDILEEGAAQVKGYGQVPFSVAEVDEVQRKQHQQQAVKARPAPAVVDQVDEVDDAEVEAEAKAEVKVEEDGLSLEQVSAMGVDVLRAALKSVERHFAITFSHSSSSSSSSSSPSPAVPAAASPAAAEQATSDSQGKTLRDSESESASGTSTSTPVPDSTAQSDPSPPPSSSPPAPASAPAPAPAEQADREGGADSQRGGAPRQAMGFGGRMMYRAQAGQRQREEREEALRRREREERERALRSGSGSGGEGGGSGELLRGARGMDGASDADGDGMRVEMGSSRGDGVGVHVRGLVLDLFC